jgi:hypothetical protein
VVLCVFCICDFPKVDLMTLVCSLKSFYEFWEINFVVESMLFVLQFIGVQFAPS